MLSDQSKIEKIKSLIKLNNLSIEQERDLTDLALSIDDQEDRDLMLEFAAIALAEGARYDKSQQLLNQIIGAYEKAEGLTKLAASLISADQITNATAALRNAEDIAHHTYYAWQTAELLDRIAHTFLLLKQIDEAMRVLERAISVARVGEENSNIQDSMDSSSVLWSISQTLAQMGEREKAYEVANSIKNQGKRERAIKSLVQ